jgi:hypothetical protein
MSDGNKTQAAAATAADDDDTNEKALTYHHNYLHHIFTRIKRRPLSAPVKPFVNNLYNESVWKNHHISHHDLAMTKQYANMDILDRVIKNTELKSFRVTPYYDFDALGCYQKIWFRDIATLELMRYDDSNLCAYTKQEHMTTLSLLNLWSRHGDERIVHAFAYLLRA